MELYNISATESTIVIYCPCLQSISCGKSTSHLATACMGKHKKVGTKELCESSISMRQVSNKNACAPPLCSLLLPPHPHPSSAATSVASNDRIKVLQGVSEAYNKQWLLGMRVIMPFWGGSSEGLNLCRILLHHPSVSSSIHSNRKKIIPMSNVLKLA